MELFSAYIDKQNQEASDKLNYKERKTFKPMKANQATLAQFLDKTTSNISNKLIGITCISKEEVLELTEKLDINGPQFIELAKLFAQQKNIMVLGPVPTHENEWVSKKIESIYESFINAITTNLLFEIILKKYPSRIAEYSYLDRNGTFASIMNRIKSNMSSFDIKEIAADLLGKPSKK